MPALCSVIIPVYNAERYLPAAIESVINQTERSLKIILVNDGSTDQSQSVMDQYAAGDTRIICLNKQNGGASDARNAGLSLADSEFVMFIDADDWIDPDTILELTSLCQNQSVDMVIAGYYHYLDDHQFHVVTPMIQQGESLVICDRDRLLSEYMASDQGVFLNSKLYRTALIKQNDLRFLTDLTIGEDYTFNLSYIAQIERCCIVGKPFYHYRFVPGSLSRKYNSKLFDSYRVVDATKRAIIKGKLGDSKLLLEMEDRYIADIYSRCINELTYADSLKQINERLGKIVFEINDKRLYDKLKIGFYQIGVLIQFMLKRNWLKPAAGVLYLIGSVRRLLRR